MLLGIGLAATLISVQAEADAAVLGVGTQVAMTLFVLDMTALAAAVVAWWHPALTPATRRAWGIMAVAFGLLAGSVLLRRGDAAGFPAPADLALLAAVPVLLTGLFVLPARLRIRVALLAAAMLATVAGETYLSIRQDAGGGMQDSVRLIAHFLLALAPLAQLRDAVTGEAAPGEPAASGVVDRRGLHDALTVELARAVRGPRTVAVVATELAGGGAELRSAYGRMLRANVLGTDVVARVAADRFIIILRDISDVSQAEAVVARLRDAMREPIIIGDTAIQPRAGFGITVANPGETDADAVLHRAVQALSDRTPTAPHQASTHEPDIR